MSLLSSSLERQAKIADNDRFLSINNGSALAAMVGVGASHFKEYDGVSDFNKWENDFSEKFSFKMDKFEAKRSNQIEEYKDLLKENDIQDFDDLKGSPEVHKMAKNLHDNDVIVRKEFEQFFAVEGGEGPENILGYHDYSNGESSYTVYNAEQLNQLEETSKVAVNKIPLEGHHVNDFSSWATDPEKLKKLFHVNNIRLMTSKAHHDDPQFGHGGHWQNSTLGKVNQVDSRKEAIVSENKALGKKDITDFDNDIGIGIGAAVSIISAIVKAHRLKDDPRPWKKKAGLVTISGFSKGILSGGSSLIALKTRTTISSFGENEAVHRAVELINQSLDDFLPGGIEGALDPESLSMLMGAGVSIAEIRIMRAGVNAIIERNNRNSKVAMRQLGCEVTTIITEEAVFFVSGMLIDMAIELVTDAATPDPTGIVAAVRITYSVGAKGYEIYVNKKTAKECKKIKLSEMYNSAISSVEKWE